MHRITIIKSLNPEDDDRINLTSTVHDAAADDVAQQISKSKIDELRFLSVGGFIFELSEYENTKDLAKALKEELIGSTDDVPLRFFSEKKNAFIAATKIGLFTSKNYGEIGARYKEMVWPLLFS